MMDDGMMNGMGAMTAIMGGGMLLIAVLLIAIGVAVGYAFAKRR